jgi:hypothetical protein
MLPWSREAYITFSVASPFGISQSDILAFESLRRLEFLDLRFNNNAGYASQCRQIKSLLVFWNEGWNDVLRAVGKNLVSLHVWEATAEACEVVVENCPHLQDLELVDVELSESDRASLKTRLKILASLKVRVGTDWTGY